jgi:hypothetical protein
MTGLRHGFNHSSQAQRRFHGYHAQVTIKRSGQIVHRETSTFDRRQAPSAWLEKRETELAKPGAVERQNIPDAKLAAVIDRYIEESKRKVTIRHDLIHDGSDYTPYEGFEVTGWPALTMVRGRVVVDDGVLVGAKGHGTYLQRTKPPTRPDAAQR